jgi:catechol 2,3-dioxygenase-like lactoylglutathione lyase family enzyme
MDWIIKKASTLTEDEKAVIGITGIPNDWPIESYPFGGTVPDGFEQISEENLAILKANNQAAYDAWVQSKRPIINLPPENPQDAEGKPFVNLSMTKLDWYYSPHALDFYTAKYGSLYNRRHDGIGIDDGTDEGDAYLEFYDTAGQLIVKGETETAEDYQIRLTANCIKTVMVWEKIESFDVVGAYLYIANAPAARAYLWVVAAPDIPYQYGGSKPFMGRGMNLQMMREKTNHYFDAKTSKTVNFDPVYHSGKVNAIVKHAAGEQIGIQLIYILYEE